MALEGETMKRSLLGCDRSVVWYTIINFCTNLPSPYSRYKIKEVSSSILMPDYMVTYIRRLNPPVFIEKCVGKMVMNT